MGPSWRAASECLVSIGRFENGVPALGQGPSSHSADRGLVLHDDRGAFSGAEDRHDRGLWLSRAVASSDGTRPPSQAARITAKMNGAKGLVRPAGRG